MTRNDRSSGMTLLEVLISFGILGIVLLGVVGVQTTSLRITGDDASNREAVRIAENEVEMQAIAISSDGVDQDCQLADGSDKVGDHTCSVSVVPCEEDAGSLTCAIDAADESGRLVVVTVTGPRDADITIQRWLP